MKTFTKVILAVAFALVGANAHAASGELRVVCTNIAKGAVQKLFPQFERASGKRLLVTYGASADLKRAIEAGAAFDLAILTTGIVDDLAAHGYISPESRNRIAKSDLAAATKAGSRKSDISTAAGMRARLMAARSISYTTDGGGAAAIVRMLASLGIPNEKVFPQAIAGHAAESAAKGEYEIAFAPLGEMASAPGALVLGLLPPEFQYPLEVSSGIGTKTADPAAAHDLAKFLLRPTSMKIMLKAGLSALQTN